MVRNPGERGLHNSVLSWTPSGSGVLPCLHGLGQGWGHAHPLSPPLTVRNTLHFLEWSTGSTHIVFLPCCLLSSGPLRTKTKTQNQNFLFWRTWLLQCEALVPTILLFPESQQPALEVKILHVCALFPAGWPHPEVSHSKITPCLNGLRDGTAKSTKKNPDRNTSICWSTILLQTEIAPCVLKTTLFLILLMR